LLVVCFKNNNNLVKYIVDHKADVKKVNNKGYSALTWACFKNNEILLFLKAYPNGNENIY